MPKKQHKKKAKTVALDEHERLKKIYAEELARKDEIIDKLREENKLLMKSALKSERNVMLAEKLKDKTKQVR